MDVVNIYTDGSCINNGTPDARAGWSYVVEGSSHAKMGKLPGDNQTNNRAELYAFLEALKYVKTSGVPARLYSDSKVLVDGVLGNSQRKANRDIWEDIEGIIPDVADSIVAVEHISRDKNKKADALARKGANALLVL